MKELRQNKIGSPEEKGKTMFKVAEKGTYQDSAEQNN